MPNLHRPRIARRAAKGLLGLCLVAALASLPPIRTFADNAGFALQFDGLNDVVALPETQSVMGNGWESTKTVSLWVLPTGVSTVCPNNSVAWCDSIFGDRSRWWGIVRGVLGGQDRIWLWNYDGGAGSPIDLIGIPYTTGAWIHISLVHDGATLHGYANGVEVGTTPSGVTLQPNTGALPKLYLGGVINGPTRNWTFEGQIDEVSLWNTARTPAEVQQDMLRILSGNEPGLSAYYRMSNGSGTVLSDNGPGGWDGTLLDGMVGVPPNGSGPQWVASGAFGDPGPTPTASATATATAAPSATATGSPSPATATATQTVTPSSTATPTAGPSVTATATASASPTPGAAGFPTTGILDGFDRPNGAPGSSWSGSTGSYQIVGGQLDVTGNGSLIWSGEAFAADQEVHLTLSAVDPDPGSTSLLLKSQSGSAATAGVIRVMYNPVGQSAQVWTYSVSQGWVSRGSAVPLSLQAGDQFGARARSNGLVEVFRNGALAGVRDVSGWTHSAGGGYLGMWMASAADAVLDDFGGGNVGAAPPPTTTPTTAPGSSPSPTAGATATPVSASPTPTASSTPTASPSPTATPVLPPSPTATPAGGGLVEVASLDTPGDAWDVALSGSSLLVADVSGGLRVVDISDPQDPVEAAGLEAVGRAYAVAAQGQYAYVAAARDGLRVVDLTDPSHPVVVGAVDTPEYAWGIAVSGDHAYVADRWGGLRIIDISDPAAPFEVGALSTADQVTDVAVSGSYAYLCAYQAVGLLVVDVSNPAAPVAVGSLNTPGAAYGIALDGNQAFVADGGSGLRIVDITNPALPLTLASYASGGWARDVAVEGGFAYLTLDSLGVLMIDVSDRTAPQPFASFDTPGRTRGVAVRAPYVYVADHEGGLRILRH